MDNKSDDQLIIMKYMIDDNMQYLDDKIKKLTAKLAEMTESMMNQIKISIS